MTDQHADGSQSKRWHIDKEINPLEVVGGVIAIFALLLLWQQSCELTKTNRIATKSLEITKESVEASMNAERANLLFERITVHGIRELAEGRPIKGNAIFISYRMKNCGNTLAWTNNITFQVRVSPQFYLPPPIFDNPTATGEKYPILPNASFPTFAPFEIKDTPVTTEQAKDILAGKQYLFVQGFIGYEDVFQRLHTSYFCYCYRFNYYPDKSGDDIDFPEPVGGRACWENN